VDRSTNEDIVGKPVAAVAGKTDDIRVQVNRYNVEAIGLLDNDRAPEADMLLRKALSLDRHNAFTLNNLGYAQEKQGELEQALSFYTAAAATGSQDRIVVTPNPGWRGKAISQIASDNASKVRRMMDRVEGTDARVARLNLRGVSAINRNERSKARLYFEQAYKLDPNDAFTLNNMGYLAEVDGDRETAKFYYEKALDAEHAKTRVDVATRKQAEGQQIATVADQSSGVVQTSMQQEVEARRRQGGPIVLKRRDNMPVKDTEPVPSSSEKPTPGPPTTGGASTEVAPATAAPAQGTSRPEDGWRPATQLPSVEPPSSSQPGQQPAQPQLQVEPPPVPPSSQQVPPPTGVTPR
jgi:Flp pilus assembly protein TadD